MGEGCCKVEEEVEEVCGGVEEVCSRMEELCDRVEKDCGSLKRCVVRWIRYVVG